MHFENDGWPGVLQFKIQQMLQLTFQAFDILEGDMFIERWTEALHVQPRYRKERYFRNDSFIYLAGSQIKTETLLTLTAPIIKSFLLNYPLPQIEKI